MGRTVFVFLVLGMTLLLPACCNRKGGWNKSTDDKAADDDRATSKGSRGQMAEKGSTSGGGAIGATGVTGATGAGKEDVPAGSTGDEAPSFDGAPPASLIDSWV